MHGICRPARAHDTGWRPREIWNCSRSDNEASIYLSWDVCRLKETTCPVQQAGNSPVFGTTVVSKPASLLTVAIKVSGLYITLNTLSWSAPTFWFQARMLNVTRSQIVLRDDWQIQITVVVTCWLTKRSDVLGKEVGRWEECLDAPLIDTICDWIGII